MIEVTKPDLILLDYEMPVCSGAQFLEMLHSEPQTKNIPVIFLTSRSDEETVKKVIELGPQGYLLKSQPKEKILESKDRKLTLEDNSVKRRVVNEEQYSNSVLSNEAENNVSQTSEEKEVKPVEQTKSTPIVETKSQEIKSQKQVSVNKTPKLIVENKQTVTHKSNKVDNSAEMELVNQGNLYVPNAFTPTESTNNVFKPAHRDLANYEIEIFSRNGKKVFSSTDIDNGWNGRINGNIADKGVYVYVIKYVDLEGMNHTQKGSLMLVR